MEVERVVDGIVDGRSDSRRHALEIGQTPDDPAFAELLDALALASSSSNSAREVLLMITMSNRLPERSVRKVLFDAADVDDATQLTLVAVAEKIGTFNGSSKYTTWLHTVARNEALMVLRRKSRKNEPSGEDVPEQHGFVQRMSSVIASREQIDAAIQRLPEQQREALVMREMDGLEYQEISDRLGVPIGTVRSRISRAREALALLLTTHLNR